MTASSYSLTKKQYDYLLPVYGICVPNQNKLMERNGRYSFIGTYSEYIEALNRCAYL